MQPVEAALGEAAAPAADRRAVAAEPRRDLLARLAVGRRQHDPAAQRQRLRALGTTRPPLKHLPLLLLEHYLCALGHDRRGR
jgi:hypothetical protein